MKHIVEKKKRRKRKKEKPSSVSLAKRGNRTNAENVGPGCTED